MPVRYSDTVLSEIRSRVSIVEEISIHVSLRKTGRNHVGLCPFHDEKTPSFSVNEERAFFHCFGCGAGGDVFTFLRRIEGLGFPEVVRRLAAKSGVDLPQAPEDPRAREHERLYKLNEVARAYFRRCLLGRVGTVARRYVTERGIAAEVAERYALGYAPASGNGFSRLLADKKAPLDKAAELGLIGESARAGGSGSGGPAWYDRFRHRLMFPITDVTGRPVGFGGRLLADTRRRSAAARPLPKYLNSPDSSLYKKGALLYGLFEAKVALRERGRALIVEGYTDLLSLVQQGFPETVAVLGTALTLDQLRLLKRFTTDLYVFFDGDDAGRRAAARAFPLCVECGLTGKGIFLPQGEDPDSFGKRHGPAGLEALIRDAVPIEELYFTEHAPRPGAPAFARARAARDAVAVLAPIRDPVARGVLLGQIAQRFGVHEEELRRLRPERTPGRAERPAAVSTDRPAERYRPSAEGELLQLMLVDARAVAHVEERNLVSAFTEWGALAADVVAAWRRLPAADAGTGIDVAAFLDRLPKAMADRVSTMLMADAPPEDDRNAGEDAARVREQLMRDCIRRIEAARRRADRARVQQEIREAERRGDDAEVRKRLRMLGEMERS